MKQSLDTPILDLAGERVPGINGADFTLRRACQVAIGQNLPGDEQMDLHTKLQLYRLGQKVEAGGEADLTCEEVYLLKKRIGASFHFITVGRCFDLLDPKE
jgi:hypothetical protein